MGRLIAKTVARSQNLPQTFSSARETSLEYFKTGNKDDEIPHIAS